MTIATVDTNSAIDRAAAKLGLRPQNGHWANEETPSRWEMRVTDRRFLQIDGQHPVGPDENILATHAVWGPFKLIGANGQTIRRFEARLGRHSGSDPFGDTTDGQYDQVLDRLIALGSAADPSAAPEDWVAPPAKYITSHLVGLGYEVATDNEDCLRLTLKRPLLDGQVRVKRGDQTLRAVLLLGRWSELDEVSIRSMVDLSTVFNRRTRLVRIAWHEPTDAGQDPEQAASAKDGDNKPDPRQPAGYRCEAQVDLTGLPYEVGGGRAYDELWSETLGASMAGLQLALRKLGAELQLLANPAHREIVELIDF